MSSCTSQARNMSTVSGGCDEAPMACQEPVRLPTDNESDTGSEVLKRYPTPPCQRVCGVEKLPLEAEEPSTRTSPLCRR